MSFDQLRAELEQQAHRAERPAPALGTLYNIPQYGEDGTLEQSHLWIILSSPSISQHIVRAAPCITKRHIALHLDEMLLPARCVPDLPHPMLVLLHLARALSVADLADAQVLGVVSPLHQKMLGQILRRAVEVIESGGLAS